MRVLLYEDESMMAVYGCDEGNNVLVEHIKSVRANLKEVGLPRKRVTIILLLSVNQPQFQKSL